MSRQGIPTCGEMCAREVYNHPGTPHQYETVTRVAIRLEGVFPPYLAGELADDSLRRSIIVSGIQSENPGVFSDEAEIGLGCALLRASGACTIELVQP